MTLSEELTWRGFINQSTFKDIKELDSKKWVFYHGFDASADSQTIGNLAAMMFDKVFIRHGNQAILLAGGATSLIGDPGGKDKERVLQSEETIRHNVEKAEQQLDKVFGAENFIIVNNIDWIKNITVLDFLRDIGKHFSMTPLVQRDYIAQRIGEGGSGISYTEFSYTLLQGLDYLHLFDNYKATLQLGGSDQWGNCLSGVELIRKARGAETHALTLPLIINKATGKKFGKSEEGAVWLDENKTSVYKFYQFWINCDDVGVEDYLKIFTELDKAAIDNIISEHKNNPSERIAQKALAYEVTKLVHGEERTNSVIKISEVMFGGGDYTKLNDEDFNQLKNELHSIKIDSIDKPIVDIIVEADLASSKTEARGFIASKSIYINGKQQNENKEKLQESDLINGHAIIRRGKNTTSIIQLAS